MSARTGAGEPGIADVIAHNGNEVASLDAIVEALNKREEAP
jgi:hypothetical protein